MDLLMSELNSVNILGLEAGERIDSQNPRNDRFMN